MPFSNFDEIMNAGTTLQRGQQIHFNKVVPSTTVALTGFTFWTGNGYPSAGEIPTVGLGGAVTTSAATAGAIAFANPGGGRKLYAVSSNFNFMGGGTGSFMLVDRLAHANIAHNQGTGSFSPVIDGTARLETGEGGLILLEVTTAFGSGTNTRSFTYTNQAGTSGRVSQTMSFVASSVAVRVPFAGPVFVGFNEQGDTGVRSIESTTLVSGTGTGAFNVALVRPITPWIPLPSIAMGVQSDFVFELPILPEIRSDSCLQMIGHSTISSTAYCLCGTLKAIEI